MRRRVLSIIITWPFLLSLVVLLVNDWYLKAAYPGFVTGKLSDFSGIAVVAFLLLAAFPRRTLTIFCGTSLAFLWWKSPASATFIQAVNNFGLFRIGRTVDYTDMIALIVFPACHAMIAHQGKLTIYWSRTRRLLVIPAVAMTLVALLGTSVIPTRQDYIVRKTSTTDELRREEVADAIKSVAAKHGVDCRECARPSEAATLSGNGITLTYSFLSKSAVSFKISAYPNGLFFGASGQQKADALRTALKAELAARFRDLEYVEPLTPKDVNRSQ